MDALEPQCVADRRDLLHQAVQAVHVRIPRRVRAAASQLVPQHHRASGLGEPFQRLEVIVPGAGAAVDHEQGHAITGPHPAVPDPAAGHEDVALLDILHGV